MAKPADRVTWTEGSLPDSRSATPKSAAAHRSQEIRMSRFTTARGAAVIAAVAASALALSACTGSGGGGSRERRRRRHVEARHRPRLRPGRARLRPAALRQRASGCSSRASTTRCSSSTRSGQVVPDLVTNFEYNEDQTQLTLDLDTTRDLRRRHDAQRRARQGEPRRARQPRPVRLQRLRRGRRERDRRRDRRRRRHRHPHLRRAQARLRVEPRLARRRRSSGPTGAADRSSLDSTPDGSGPLAVDADATVKGNSYLLVKKEDDAGSGRLPLRLVRVPSRSSTRRRA